MNRLTEKLFILVAKMIPTGMIIPVKSGPLKGKKWIAGAAAGTGKGLSVILNHSEQKMLNYIIGIISSSGTPRVCFDFGANVGFYTLLFSMYADAVYSFEPFPRNLHYLVKLIEVNKLDNVHVIPAAVSSCSKISFFSKGENAALGRLNDKGTIPVLSITCDQFTEETGIIPDMIKIDVEGSELDLLHGAVKTLKKHHPSIILSIHGKELRRDCINFLRETGYTAILPAGASSIEKASDISAIYH